MQQALYVRAAPSVGLVDGLDEKTGEQLARHRQVTEKNKGTCKDSQEVNRGGFLSD